MSMGRHFAVVSVICSLIVPVSCRQRANTPGGQSVTFAAADESRLTPDQRKHMADGRAQVSQAVKSGTIGIYGSNGKPLEGELVINADTKFGDLIFVTFDSAGQPNYGVQIIQSKLQGYIGSYTVTAFAKDLKTPILVKTVESKMGDKPEMVVTRLQETAQAMALVAEKDKRTETRPHSVFKRSFDLLFGSIESKAYGGDSGIVAAGKGLLKFYMYLASIAAIVMGGAVALVLLLSNDPDKFDQMPRPLAFLAGGIALYKLTESM